MPGPIIGLIIWVVFLVTAGTVFLVITKKKGLWGDHQINYRDTGDAQSLEEASFSVPVIFSEADYIYKKRYLTESWILNVGKALDSILNIVVNRAVQQSSTAIIIKDLKVLKFDRGFWIWSNHSVTISFTYEIKSNGDIVKSGEIQETGSESGDGTLIPGFGMKKYDIGIELAMSRSLLNCLRILRQQVEPFQPTTPTPYTK